MDYWVGLEVCPYAKLIDSRDLAVVRHNHGLYFVDIGMKFRKRLPQGNYNLTIELYRTKMFKCVIYADFIFSVDDYIRGTFKGSIPTQKQFEDTW